MKINILDLTRQYKQLQEKLEKAVLDQMSSGQYIGGTAVNDFEKKIAAYLGVKHAITLNSGTDALVIALKALNINQNDEVITTPFSFFATAEAIALTGAKPVFADIDETYNLDPDKIEAKITAKTKAILPVHIFGQPANMEKINAIAEKYSLYTIEDACQAIGSSINKKKTGTFGNLACFSFFPTKNLGAFGDGGMITTNDDNLAVICRAYKEHGGGLNGLKANALISKEQSPDIDDAKKYDGALYNPYKYYNYLIAYNSRLDAIQARVLNIKLDYLDAFNQKRKEIAERYNDHLSKIKEIKIPVTRGNCVHVWHQYAFRCNDKIKLGEFLAEKGIGSAAFYPVPLHLQKAFAYLGYKKGDLPLAEEITKQTVCLPVYPELTKEEQDYIIKCIESFYKTL